MDLRADGVTKRFGPMVAVDGVSLAVESGTSIAVHGPNGSGKTTLLRMLAGLSVPNEGTVSVGGRNLYDRETAAVRSIGFLSHDSMLYDGLSARENLEFHARLWDLPETRVTEVLETVDLLDRAWEYPRQFSHGMQKRLSLARAVLSDPEILLLDEPFTGLDRDSRMALTSMFDARTVVLVTHDPEVSIEHCDRFVVLDEGRVVGQVEDDSLEATEFRDVYRQVSSS